MTQMGFFDVENGYAVLDAKQDHLGEDQCRRSLGSIPQPPRESLAQAVRSLSMMRANDFLFMTTPSLNRPLPLPFGTSVPKSLSSRLGAARNALRSRQGTRL